MAPRSKTPSVRRNLSLNTGDGAAFSVMVGIGESYFAAFALAIGFSEALAGLLGAVPIIFGALLQLASPTMVRVLGSNRRWVVLCALLQSLTFVPLIAGAALGRLPLPVLMTSVALYWATGMAGGPAWMSWMGAIIPSRIRARFFARRMRVAQLCVLFGLLAGGMLLRHGTEIGATTRMFALLFGIALLMRLVSTVLLWMQSEPIAGDARPAMEKSGRLPTGGNRLLMYMLTVQLAVQISGPFFTPYMLGRLEFQYDEFMLVLGASFVTKAIMLPAIGAAARRFGTHRILWFGGVGIIPMSALWLVSDSLWYLLVIQVLSGCMWACYEMATFLLLFETIPQADRTRLLTRYNLANAIALVIGSSAGATLLKSLGEARETYHLLFVCSSVVRLLTLIPLSRVGRTTFEPEPLSVMPLNVRPGAGSLDRPMLPGLRNRAAEVDDTDEQSQEL